MRTNCQCHCSGCNSHFAGLNAFDAHRRGEGAERHCVDPMDDDRFCLKTDEGVCDMRPPKREGVRLWQLTRDVKQLSGRGFRGSRPPVG